MRRTIRILAAIGLLGLLLAGCGKGQAGEERMDLEFTVVDEARLPEELFSMIEKKKAEPFKLTYGDGGYLYLCMGYGEQPTGGYSITVNELYATRNAIYLDTGLIGPKEAPEKGENPSYPYIVIKTPFVDKTVVFD
ncbi:MAG: protease complex subunit PrcB family protein [Eubacteriales bacterium]|nr:protease complex subunit PrcB family protein [Eubacteriales bacterium]